MPAFGALLQSKIATVRQAADSARSAGMQATAGPEASAAIAG